MRRERSFLILVVLGIALGAYIYFVERKRPASDEPEAKPKVFEALEAADIEELVITAPDDEMTRLARQDGSWQLVEPVTAAADENEVNGLTSSLTTVERVDVVDENPKSLKEFGLEPARAEVAFRTKDSTELRRLLIGDRVPTGAELYAKLPGETRVFLIPSYLESSLIRTTFQLRDKAVLKFDRDKAESLEVVTPDHRIRMTHAPTEWRIVEPLTVRADFGAAESLVGRLSTAQMKSIVSSEPLASKAMSDMGFTRPTATAIVATGSARATLLVGGKTKEGDYYARDTARPLVFTVEPALVEEMTKPVSDFRRKDVFEFRPFSATRIELTRDGTTYVFEKVKTEEKEGPTTEKWRQTAPSTRDIDLSKMDPMLSAFSNMRAESWVASTSGLGLDTPQITLAAKFDEGKKEERVAFARKGDQVHVMRADEPGAAKISTADYETATRALDELLK
jgi:hypothetical protein